VVSAYDPPTPLKDECEPPASPIDEEWSNTASHGSDGPTSLSPRSFPGDDAMNVYDPPTPLQDECEFPASPAGEGLLDQEPLGAFRLLWLPPMQRATSADEDDISSPSNSGYLADMETD